MRTYKICNLEIDYKETEIKELKRILEILKNNKVILVILKKTKITIKEFDEFFEKTIIKLMKDNTFIKQAKNKDYIMQLYINIYRNINKDNFDYIPDALQIPYLYAAKEYYNDDIEKIKLFTKDTCSYKKEIDNWIKNVKYKNIYEYLIEQSIKEEKKYKNSFSNTIEELENIIKEINQKYLSPLKNEYEKIKEINNGYQMPQINNKEIDILFKNFLKEINAPKQWFNHYEMLKNENNISYINEYDEEQISHYKRENGKDIIKLECINELEIFPIFVHEFMHSIYNTSTKYNILSEFPSIYYETKAIEYLSKIYNDNNLYLFINNKRINNNYLKSKIIEREIIDYKEYKKNRNIKFDNNNKEIYEKIIVRKINNKSLFEGLEYIVGSYLTYETILSKMNIDNKMIELSQNIEDHTISSVSDYLGINTKFKDNKYIEIKNKIKRRLR